MLLVCMVNLEDLEDFSCWLRHWGTILHSCFHFLLVGARCWCLECGIVKPRHTPRTLIPDFKSVVPCPQAGTDVKLCAPCSNIQPLAYLTGMWLLWRQCEVKVSQAELFHSYRPQSALRLSCSSLWATLHSATVPQHSSSHVLSQITKPIKNQLQRSKNLNWSMWKWVKVIRFKTLMVDSTSSREPELHKTTKLEWL